MSTQAGWYPLARPQGTHKEFRRVGRHARTGRFYWYGTTYALALRKRKLLRAVIGSAEHDEFFAWARQQKLEPKLVLAEQTPHVTGKEGNIHPKLLASVEAFMRANGKGSILNILSGFRSYAEQLRLWTGWRLRIPGFNPANPPGSSKHEASGGYTSARAIDAYVGGRAFWTWCDAHGLRAFALKAGLRQPHSHEPWHVELDNL